jgi:single-strand DNA-binding protein
VPQGSDVCFQNQEGFFPMNSITVAGSLGRDAELRHLPNGDAVLNFSVADSAGRDKPTIWWNCQLFGKRAESLAQYLTKGQAVAVSGSVSEREWTDKDGNTKKSMNVRVNEVALQGKREEAKPKPAQQKADYDDSDESLPF